MKICSLIDVILLCLSLLCVIVEKKGQNAISVLGDLCVDEGQIDNTVTVQIVQQEFRFGVQHVIGMVLC